MVIGGDGSLTGAHLFRQEWAGLVAELAAQAVISAETAAQHPYLADDAIIQKISAERLAPVNDREYYVVELKGD